MTDKIYEYKDDQDWYVGKIEDYAYISSFTEDDDFELIRRNLMDLLDFNLEGQNTGFQVHVIKYQSDFKLIRFVLDMANEILGRALVATQHKGAILITENDQLLWVKLPKAGLPLSDFMTSSQSLGDKILIATRNEGKTKEFREFFHQLGYGVENLNAYPDLPEIEETGTTFEENARLKAETIANLTGQIVLADDSGLKVDILGGLPGVWSARFSGPEATDQSNIQKLLHELAVVHDLKKRSAQFHTTLVLAKPGKDSLVVEADWPGYIAFEAKGENGFGYDPVFLVGETGRHSAELTVEEKNAQSHRGLALKKLLEVFPSW